MGLFKQQRRGKDKTVLVTGASGGIGEALAREFAHDGFNLILVARTGDALEKLADALSGQYGVTAMAISHDLGAIGAGQTLMEKLGPRANDIYILVNNAGFGLVGAFDALDGARELNMVDLNVRVLTELCHAVIPQMRARKGGGIMNVGSVAGFQPGPFMAIYYASKAYVRSFSEALNEELRGTGVHVMALCPGPVQTGFQARAEATKDMKLFNLIPMTTAEEVARQGRRAFFQRRRTYVPGWFNWLLTLGVSFAPRWFLLRVTRYLHT